MLDAGASVTVGILLSGETSNKTSVAQTTASDWRRSDENRSRLRVSRIIYIYLYVQVASELMLATNLDKEAEPHWL